MRKLLLSLVMGGVLFAQTNLLQNPGFENWTGGNPDNWSHDNGITVEQCSVADSVHSGTYSARVTLTTQTQSNADFYSDEVSVNAGTQYEVSFWIFDDDPAGKARLVVMWYDSNHNDLSTDYTIYSGDSNEWQHIIDTLTAPTNAAYARLDIRFYDVSSNWNGEALFYVDDASFIALSTNRPPSISNISYSPTEPTSNDDVTVTADITDPDGDNISKDSLYYSTDNGNTWTDIYHSNVSGNTYSYTIPAQSNGTTVQYYIIAEDDQGERSTSDTISYTVSDNPVISNVTYSPSTPTSSDDVIATADITDPNGDLATDSLYYSTDNGNSWNDVYRDSVGTNSNTHYYTIPAQSDGTTVQFFIIAKDNQGNRTASDTISYTVSDLLPPVINEIMYNPDDGNWASDNHGEWVEIYNPNDTPYDVGQWTLTDGEASFTIPSGISIPPFGYLVIASDTDTVRTLYSSFLGDGNDSLIGNSGLGLSNSGDQVVLKNASGATIDTVNYDDSSPWPSEPDGNGPSLALKNPDFDNNDASNWCADTDDGTPGAANSCGNVVLNPGFESWTGGTPDHWNLGNNATCSQENTHRHRGSSSAKLSVTSDGDSIYQDIEQVTGGKPYHLHVWVYALGEVNGHPSVGVILKYYNGNWNHIGDDGPFYPNSTGKWSVIAHRDTINPNATKMRICIVGYSTTKGDAGYIDDVNFVSEGAVATKVNETPAPKTDKLTVISSLTRIKFTIHSQAPVELNIYNIAGQRILTRNFIRETEITTSRMPRGVYFAVVKQSGEIIAHAKFVIFR